MTRFDVSAAYITFAPYPCRPLVQQPDDCASEETIGTLNQRLRDKDLRQLSASDLVDYFYLAIAHIGSVEDFKHYLPRVLELMAFDSEAFSPEILMHQLRATGVESWPANERLVVLNFYKNTSHALGRRGTPEDVEKLLRMSWSAA